MLNTLTASIAGMHKEEVLARLAAHDAPISFLPLDYLCALLHQSLRAAVPSGPASARTHTDVIHLRMACRGSQRRGSNLIRMETVKLFNANGQVTQVDLTLHALARLYASVLEQKRGQVPGHRSPLFSN
jgi:hypothetical protein